MYDEEGNLLAPTSDAGFFAAARDRVAGYLTPITAFAQTQAGGQLFNAIYEFGRGKIDAAREKAVGAFLMTSQGQKIRSEATRQTINQHLPKIVIGGAVVIFLILVLFSKK